MAEPEGLYAHGLSNAPTRADLGYKQDGIYVAVATLGSNNKYRLLMQGPSSQKVASEAREVIRDQGFRERGMTVRRGTKDDLAGSFDYVTPNLRDARSETPKLAKGKVDPNMTFSKKDIPDFLADYRKDEV